jgi:hypothetical protein
LKGRGARTCIFLPSLSATGKVLLSALCASRIAPMRRSAHSSAVRARAVVRTRVRAPMCACAYARLRARVRMHCTRPSLRFKFRSMGGACIACDQAPLSLQPLLFSVGNGTFHSFHCQLAPIPVQGVLVGETAYCLSSRIAWPQSRPAICAIRVQLRLRLPGLRVRLHIVAAGRAYPDRRSLARRDDALRRCVTRIARTDQSPQRDTWGHGGGCATVGGRPPVRLGVKAGTPVHRDGRHIPPPSVGGWDPSSRSSPLLPACGGGGGGARPAAWMRVRCRR